MRLLRGTAYIAREKREVTITAFKLAKDLELIDKEDLLLVWLPQRNLIFRIV